VRKVNHLKSRLAKVKKAEILKKIEFKTKDVILGFSMEGILDVLKEKYIFKRKGIFANRTKLVHMDKDFFVLEVLPLKEDVQIKIIIKTNREDTLFGEYRSYKAPKHNVKYFLGDKTSMLENINDLFNFLTTASIEDPYLNL
jgi:hypothetical protein